MFRIKRRRTRGIKVGEVKLGGNNPVRVQSMCNTNTKDIAATVKQIQYLEDAGCEIVRVAVPDIESAGSVKKIGGEINIPLVADVHYNYKLAIECLNNGIDKIRINPGNITPDKLKSIANKAKDTGTPLRIGINIGSLPKRIVARLGNTPEAMVESALTAIRLFEGLGFYELVVSLKSSDIQQTITANRMFSEKSDYPLHLGITEAGTIRAGTIKSSIGIGCLLLNGVGDTIRVSLTADPVEEVIAGYTILSSLGLRKSAMLVSCPTCGRAEIDIIKVANEVEKKLAQIERPLKIGILGCFVNIEEAKMADIGIAGLNGYGILFKEGKMLRKVEKEKLVEELLKAINNGV